MVKEDKIEAEAEVRLGLKFVEMGNALKELDYLGKLKIISNVLELNVDGEERRKTKSRG